MLEWCFVTTPEVKLRWPKEQEKVPLPQQDRCMPSAKRDRQKSLWSVAREELFVAREVMPREELIARMDEKNRLLEELGYPSIHLAGAFAARLYTGPMFVKCTWPNRTLCRTERAWATDVGVRAGREATSSQCRQCGLARARRGERLPEQAVGHAVLLDRSIPAVRRRHVAI